jgi:VWFA-related protein
MRLLHCTAFLGLLTPSLCQHVSFSTDVKVVTLLATVHDSSGAIIKNLTKDDFRVEEDGRQQTIRYFSRESDLPLTIGLLVDTSRSMHSVFEPERLASNRFFEQVLREDRDRAAVVRFDISVQVLQGLTSSRERLGAALAGLSEERRISTLLYDAIHQAADELMRPQQGRRAFILLSDGRDVGSHTSLSHAIEFAQRADTIIYSVLFAHRLRWSRGSGTGVRSGGRNAERGPKTMERLARETGGEYFQVSGENSIDSIYARIEEDLRNQYSIGYTPDRPGSDVKYRKVKLTTTQKGAIVRTRDGYFPR